MWYKEKTLWAGIAGIVAAAGGFFTGVMSPEFALQAVVSAVMVIFLRKGAGNPKPKKILKQNTTRAGLVSIAATAVGAVTGTLPIGIAVQTGLTALAGIFLRQGINKTK